MSSEDLSTLAKIELPNGAINSKDVAISADGKYAYITYVFARFNVPTTQLERGWMNTNSIAIIDIPGRKWVHSFLLDENTLGAANPWGIGLSPDGKTLAVASSGTHEISLIDLPAVHEKLLEPRAPRDPEIEDDLNFLAGMRKRVSLGGLGPRGLLWMKHLICVAEYYSDDIAVVDTKNGDAVSRINIGGNTKMTKARTGDLFFNDARMCFQSWLSCSTCHPATRSDNLNWDLVNDGIGNPKQSKSMLFSHYTPPTMITGIRADAETCVRAGLIYIQFVERSEEDAVCVDEFMKRLLPVPSPYAPAGVISESAEMGKALFNSAGCADCHKGKYFTDMKLHDIGTAVGPDVGKPFDTPTLREVWRSAPYLFDGRAKTLFDMMKHFNENGRHGNTKDLTDEDLRDLEQYILTL
jgi:cytochrome c553